MKFEDAVRKMNSSEAVFKAVGDPTHVRIMRGILEYEDYTGLWAEYDRIPLVRMFDDEWEEVE